MPSQILSTVLQQVRETSETAQESLSKALSQSDCDPLLLHFEGLEAIHGSLAESVHLSNGSYHLKLNASQMATMLNFFCESQQLTAKVARCEIDNLEQSAYAESLIDDLLVIDIENDVASAEQIYNGRTEEIEGDIVDVLMNQDSRGLDSVLATRIARNLVTQVVQAQNRLSLVSFLKDFAFSGLLAKRPQIPAVTVIHKGGSVVEALFNRRAIRTPMIMTPGVENGSFGVLDLDDTAESIG